MTSINRVTLLGSLGRDAEIKAVGDGTHKVCNLSVATNRSKKTQSGDWETLTDWHRVVVWNPHEKLVPMLTKGAKVLLEGRLETRSWDDQNGQKRYLTEVVCNGRDVAAFQRPGGNGPAQPQQYQQRPQQQQQRTAVTPPDDGDDIPF